MALYTKSHQHAVLAAGLFACTRQEVTSQIAQSSRMGTFELDLSQALKQMTWPNFWPLLLLFFHQKTARDAPIPSGLWCSEIHSLLGQELAGIPEQSTQQAPLCQGAVSTTRNSTYQHLKSSYHDPGYTAARTGQRASTSYR